MIIWNVKKIGNILSSFNYSGASYYDVSAYYFLSMTGEGYYTQIAGNSNCIEEWHPRTWRRAIRRAPISGFGLKDLIGCLRIEFTYDTRYVLEMTDVFKGYFDLITLRDGDEFKEVHLTFEESKRIKGARDVAKFVESLPPYRFKQFSRKPPEVIGKKRKLIVGKSGWLTFGWAASN